MTKDAAQRSLRTFYEVVKIDKRTIGWTREKDLFQTMIIAITIMNVLPEKQKEVLQTLLSMIEQPGKEKGCLSYGIFCDIEDNNVFNLISEWETRQYLDHHMKSDRFRVLLGTKSLLSEPLKIQIFTVIDSEDIEAVYSIRKKETVFPHIDAERSLLI